MNANGPKTTCLHLLHEYIDWMQTWGDPRSSREEKEFYDKKAEIDQSNLSLKPFVHDLRLHLERFLDDFQKQTHFDEEVGTTFIKSGSDLLEQYKENGRAFAEDGPLDHEVQTMIAGAVKRVKGIMQG